MNKSLNCVILLVVVAKIRHSCGLQSCHSSDMADVAVATAMT